MTSDFTPFPKISLEKSIEDSVLEMDIDIVGHFSTTVQLNYRQHWFLYGFSLIVPLSGAFILLFGA